MTLICLETIDPGFQFPIQLTTLKLMFKGSADVALLTPLTRLRCLDIDVNEASDPLDLSGLTTLTLLNARWSPVSRLPMSLVNYKVNLRADTNLSHLTNLTSLSVCLEPGIRATFPTGLKQLQLAEGELTNTNVGDVALETMTFSWQHQITLDELERLPKTLKTVTGRFEPESLKAHLCEIFPLIEPSP